MKLSRLTLAILLLGSAVALSACGGETRKMLGLGKTPPDEFTVVKRAPLSLPPNYALRPPEPGAARPQEPSPTEQARQQVFGLSRSNQTAPTTGALASLGGGQPFASSGFALGGAGLGTQDRSVTQGVASTPGTQVFRGQLGLNQADPNIRTTLAKENTQIAAADRQLIDTLLFWREPPPAPATVVDPQAERKRLQENAALGNPTNTGEVPTIERKRRGVSLF